jgi:hypothetical protein
VDEKKYIDVFSCARCGEDHRGLEFKNFTNPITFGELLFEFWGICPTTKEPLIRHEDPLVEDKKGEE